MFNASLPSLPSAFSRRRAIMGVAAMAASPVLAPPAMAVPAVLDAVDARLIQLTDAYYALDAAHRASASIDDRTLDLVMDRYGAIEEEMAETAAASMAGVLAKAKLCQLGIFRDCICANVPLSIADDLVRLYAEGGARV